MRSLLKAVGFQLVIAASFAVSASAQDGAGGAEIISVRPSATTGTKQGLPFFKASPARTPAPRASP